MKKIIYSRWLYVVLFLAGCAILTNVFVTAMVKKKAIEERTISSAPKIINTEKTYEVQEEKQDKDTEIKETEIIEEKAETVSTKTEVEEDEGFIMPVIGEMLNKFSGNELVYSETLKEYRTHKGIDIKSPILSQVKATSSGVVESVKKDGLMGITIVIDHQNGFKSVYSNLSTNEMVTKGDIVKQGDIISGVGDTALIETGLEGHLHFELIKDGIQVNPEEYFN